MHSTRGRILFGLLLTLVLLFELLHQITGNVLHEVVGAAFFVCIILHLSFARKWLSDAASALGAGTLTKRQKQLGVVVVLLAVDTLVLLVSSIMISELLWNAGIDLSALNPGKIWYPVHTVAAYLLCILVLAHLSMHWVSVVRAFRVQYDPSRREAISQAINGVAMIGGIALAITGVARAGFQASDYAVNVGEEEKETVKRGYREVNAQTGEYVTTNSFEATSLSDSESSREDSQSTESASPTTCPLCPRQCKLTSPRCNRPYEAGLIS